MRIFFLLMVLLLIFGCTENTDNLKYTKIKETVEEIRKENIEKAENLTADDYTDILSKKSLVF